MSSTPFGSKTMRSSRGGSHSSPVVPKFDFATLLGGTPMTAKEKKLELKEKWLQTNVFDRLYKHAKALDTDREAIAGPSLGHLLSKADKERVRPLTARPTYVPSIHKKRKPELKESSPPKSARGSARSSSGSHVRRSAIEQHLVDSRPFTLKASERLGNNRVKRVTKALVNPMAVSSDAGQAAMRGAEEAKALALRRSRATTSQRIINALEEDEKRRLGQVSESSRTHAFSQRNFARTLHPDGRSSNKLRVIQQSMVSPLLNVAQEGATSELRRMAAPAVAALAETSEANCKTLVEGGAMASMMGVAAQLSTGATNPSEIAQAWEGVAGLCKSGASAVMFIQHGGLPMAYQAAQVKHCPLAEAVLRCLGNVLKRAPLKVNSEVGGRCFTMLSALAGQAGSEMAALKAAELTLEMCKEAERQHIIIPRQAVRPLIALVMSPPAKETDFKPLIRERAEAAEDGTHHQKLGLKLPTDDMLEPEATTDGMRLFPRVRKVLFKILIEIADSSDECARFLMEEGFVQAVATMWGGTPEFSKELSGKVIKSGSSADSRVQASKAPQSDQTKRRTSRQSSNEKVAPAQATKRPVFKRSATMPTQNFQVPEQSENTKENSQGHNPFMKTGSMLIGTDLSREAGSSIDADMPGALLTRLSSKFADVEAHNESGLAQENNIQLQYLREELQGLYDVEHTLSVSERHELQQLKAWGQKLDIDKWFRIGGDPFEWLQPSDKQSFELHEGPKLAESEIVDCLRILSIIVNKTPSSVWPLGQFGPLQTIANFLEYSIPNRNIVMLPSEIELQRRGLKLLLPLLSNPDIIEQLRIRSSKLCVEAGLLSTLQRLYFEGHSSIAYISAECLFTILHTHANASAFLEHNGNMQKLHAMVQRLLQSRSSLTIAALGAVSSVAGCPVNISSVVSSGLVSTMQDYTAGILDGITASVPAVQKERMLIASAVAIFWEKSIDAISQMPASTTFKSMKAMGGDVARSRPSSAKAQLLNSVREANFATRKLINPVRPASSSVYKQSARPPSARQVQRPSTAHTASSRQGNQTLQSAAQWSLIPSQQLTVQIVRVLCVLMSESLSLSGVPSISTFRRSLMHTLELSSLLVPSTDADVQNALSILIRAGEKSSQVEIQIAVRTVRRAWKHPLKVLQRAERLRPRSKFDDSHPGISSILAMAANGGDDVRHNSSNNPVRPVGSEATGDIETVKQPPSELDSDFSDSDAESETLLLDDNRFSGGASSSNRASEVLSRATRRASEGLTTPFVDGAASPNPPKAQPRSGVAYLLEGISRQQTANGTEGTTNGTSARTRGGAVAATSSDSASHRADSGAPALARVSLIFGTVLEPSGTNPGLIHDQHPGQSTMVPSVSTKI